MLSGSASVIVSSIGAGCFTAQRQLEAEHAAEGAVHLPCGQVMPWMIGQTWIEYPLDQGMFTEELSQSQGCFRLGTHA